MSAAAVCVDGIITLLKQPRKRHQLANIHSGWIDRHGNFYEVEMEGHSDWSYEYYGKGYTELESAGWVHFSFSSFYYYPGNARKTLSRQQVDTIERWFDHQGDPDGLARLMKRNKHFFSED